MHPVAIGNLKMSGEFVRNVGILKIREITIFFIIFTIICQKIIVKLCGQGIKDTYNNNNAYAYYNLKSRFFFFFYHLTFYFDVPNITIKRVRANHSIFLTF